MQQIVHYFPSLKKKKVMFQVFVSSYVSSGLFQVELIICVSCFCYKLNLVLFQTLFQARFITFVGCFTNCFIFVLRVIKNM